MREYSFIPDSGFPLRVLRSLVLLLFAIFSVQMAWAGSREQLLEEKVRKLELELSKAREELSAVRDQASESQRKVESLTAPIEFHLLGGTLSVGGAMRANYAIGDYPENQAASRAGEDGGNFSLDVWRINLDYANDSLTGKFEYRWYNGYNFLHTGWVGYQFEQGGQVRVGVHRVPFGPGPYGVSQSWLFDQHYYAGLSDDMDAGIRFIHSVDSLSFDLAYYYTDEGTYTGASNDSARYSYDVVNESGNGYEEKHQFNARAIYAFSADHVQTTLGVSLQYGQLDSSGAHDDGDHHAISVHMVNKWSGFTLASQLTSYRYDVDAAQPLGVDTLVQTGAYDFPSTLAAEAWVPAVSLSYYHATSGIPWLDYVIPYVEYSALVKDESGFNDSELATIGAAWGRGGWYIYTDLAWSNGNEFVGGDTPFGDRLGANAADDWISRFNINFGYYF